MFRLPNPFIAGLISFFLPGAGHIYVRLVQYSFYNPPFLMSIKPLWMIGAIFILAFAPILPLNLIGIFIIWMMGIINSARLALNVRRLMKEVSLENNL